MSTRITCPGCGRSLSLPGDCTASELSCPRCLARIPNPQAPITSTAVQVEEPAASLPTAASSGATERGPRSRTADVDVAVRRDSRGMSGCLILLAVLGGIGIALLVQGGIFAASQGALFILYYVLGFLLLLAVISAVLVFVLNPNQPPRAKIGRTVLGMLTISGVLVLLGGAVLIFLFVVCLVG